MKYEYKTIAAPKHLSCKAGTNLGETLSEYIQTKINSETKEGWEFYRTDSYSIQELPGCLAALFGQEGKVEIYNILIFRKIKED